MKTIKELIKELEKFPEDAKCWAYEGEDTGISICDDDTNKFGFISCGESSVKKDLPTVELN